MLTPEAWPPIGSITNARTWPGPIRSIVSSSAAKLAAAADSGLAARKASGAGIFSEYTAMEPHSPGAPTSPLRPRAWSVAPW